jgi:hypothetical protein
MYEKQPPQGLNFGDAWNMLVWVHYWEQVMLSIASFVMLCDADVMCCSDAGAPAK